MWTNSDLKIRAKANLKRNYWGAVLGGVLLPIASSSSSSSLSSFTTNIRNSGVAGLGEEQVMALVAVLLAVSFVGAIIGIALQILVFNPLIVGLDRYFVTCQTQEKTDMKLFGFGFKNSYGNIVLAMFLQRLFIVLWSLLCVIPGIYKSYQWMLVPYILAENPGMKAADARRKSAELMDGNKWKAFVLELSFLGWILLSLCTCGILAVFYVTPYQQLTYAEFYTAVKAEKAGSVQA